MSHGIKSNNLFQNHPCCSIVPLIMIIDYINYLQKMHALQSLRTSDYYWTGARYVKSKINYTWIGSEQILSRYSNLWFPGEPTVFPPPIILCVMLDYIDFLQDLYCSFAYGYICEVDHLYANTCSYGNTINVSATQHNFDSVQP